MSDFKKAIGFDKALVLVQEKIKKNKETLKELLNQETKTYDNFITPLQLMEERLSILITPYFHLNSVTNGEDTQNLYSSLLEPLTEYGTFISQNLDIYNAVKEVEKNEKDLPQVKQKVLQDMIKGFELSGVNLPQVKKQRLQEISLRLGELKQQFSQNVLNATNEYELIMEEEDVKGLPETDKELAKTEEGKYKFTLQIPSYIAYMTYGQNRNHRETLYKAYSTRAPQNEENIDEILKLKMEKVQILGFQNYSEYSVAQKSAPSKEVVLDFLTDMGYKTKQKAKFEREVLEGFASKKGLKSKLQPWDVAFYSEQLKEETFKMNEEEYKPYFEKNSVVKGLFDFIEKMWKIKFEEETTLVWEDKVKMYNLSNEKGEKVGQLYIDLEARQNKQGGAWMNNWHSKLQDQTPSAYVVCNFPPSTKETPSLLRHSDVVTLFHEMGHALHHLLTQVTEPEVGGINVDWDVVEYPSQFLEYFSYEKEVLQCFAKHYQTGEILPDNMIAKLKESKNFQSAMATIRQVEFALFDFKLHLKYHTPSEVQELLDEIRKEFSPLIPPSYNKFQNSFSHIFAGGYSAGYYSYKWAEVLSAHTFLKYLESDNKEEFALAYRDIINGKGGSQTMDILFRELNEEDPEVESLLKIDGII